MAFTRAARAENFQTDYVRRQSEMHERGWCQVLVTPHMLDELNIGSVCEGPRSSTIAYAPVWVHVVWRRCTLTRKGLKQYLLETRDSYYEQEIICTEYMLDPSAPRDKREVARAYLDLLQKAKEQK